CGVQSPRDKVGTDVADVLDGDGSSQPDGSMRVTVSRDEIPLQTNGSTVSFPWPDLSMSDEDEKLRADCLARELPASGSLNTAHQQWGSDLLELRNYTEAALEEGDLDKMVSRGATYGLCAVHYSNEALRVQPP